MSKNQRTKELMMFTSVKQSNTLQPGLLAHHADDPVAVVLQLGRVDAVVQPQQHRRHQNEARRVPQPPADPEREGTEAAAHTERGKCRQVIRSRQHVDAAEPQPVWSIRGCRGMVWAARSTSSCPCGRMLADRNATTRRDLPRGYQFGRCLGVHRSVQAMRPRRGRRG